MARYTETIYPVKKLVPLTSAMAEAISEYRHRQRISSENEAIRRLIEAGLKGAPVAPPTGTDPAGSDKPPHEKAAPRARKPAAEPKAKPAAPLSKFEQLRALRERGT
jgi:hypothetical protein